MTEVMTNTVGNRITYCRSSLCLTRKELAQEWGEASIPTLARWELDTGKVSNKKLSSLSVFFNEKGLLVTEQWLINGSGAPPLLLKKDLFDELDFDSLAQEQLLDINRKTEKFIFGQVKNNLMAPILKYGDYVGGGNLIGIQEMNSIKGELIFIRKKGIGLIVGLCKNCANAICIENFYNVMELIDLEQIDAIGKVQWIARRQ